MIGSGGQQELEEATLIYATNIRISSGGQQELEEATGKGGWTDLTAVETLRRAYACNQGAPARLG